MDKKQLIIIGGGPIGLACGLAAKQRNIDYLILEKGTIVNSLYHYPLYMTFFSTAERLEIGGLPFSCIKPKPGRPEAIEYYRKVVENQNLNIKLFTPVLEIQKDYQGDFLVKTDETTYISKNVILATGFYDIPQLLNIPGEQLPKVRHYYREPHEYAFQKVVVVGAQNSAIDAALQTYRKGADVTLVIRGSEVGQRVKYWIRPDIINRIQEGNIKAFFNSTLQEVAQKTVTIKTPKGIKQIPNDFVLAMTGYQPENRFMKALGVVFTKDQNEQPIFNEETMETDIRGLFLAGVVCGGRNTHDLMIENSRIHAERILNCIRKRYIYN